VKYILADVFLLEAHQFFLVDFLKELANDQQFRVGSLTCSLIFENHWSGVHVPHTCLPVCSFNQKERITTLRNTDCLISPTKALYHLLFTFLQHDLQLFPISEEKFTHHNEMIEAFDPLLS
jgi:hypothetical protein